MIIEENQLSSAYNVFNTIKFENAIKQPPP